MDIAIWGIGDGWEENDRAQGMFLHKGFKNIMLCHEGVAELEIGRESRRGKILSLAAKYCCRVRQMGKEGNC
jgi:hypothetical protein